MHGRLAWFLAAANTARTPVLHWWALPADRGRDFGTGGANAARYTEAEDVVRRIRDTVNLIAR